MTIVCKSPTRQDQDFVLRALARIIDNVAPYIGNMLPQQPSSSSSVVVGATQSAIYQFLASAVAQVNSNEISLAQVLEDAVARLINLINLISPNGGGLYFLGYLHEDSFVSAMEIRHKEGLLLDLGPSSSSSENKTATAASTIPMGPMSADAAAKLIRVELQEPADKLKCIALMCHKLGSERALQLSKQALFDATPDKTAGGCFFKAAKKIVKLEEANANVTLLTTASTAESQASSRAYQLDACRQVGSGNALVVLPTGKGKTRIGKLVCEQARQRVHHRNKNFACLFVCQDRVLCNQQCMEFAGTASITTPPGLPELKLAWAVGGGSFNQWNAGKQQFTDVGGDLTLGTWDQVLHEFDVVFVTAGLLVGLLDTPDRVRYLQSVSLVIFDETHHAGEGAHNFVHLSKMFSTLEQHCQILGLTASPVSGSTNEAELELRLDELLKNLGNAKLVCPDWAAEEATNGGGQGEIKQIKVTLENAADDVVEKAMFDLADALVEHSAEFSRTPVPPCLTNNGVYGESVIKWAMAEEELAGSGGGANREAKACFFAISRVVYVLLQVQTLGAICAKEMAAVALAVSGMYTDPNNNNNNNEEEDDDDDDGETLCLVLDTIRTVIAPHVPSNFRCKRFDYVLGRLKDKQAKTLIRAKTKSAVHWLTRELRRNGIQAVGLVSSVSEKESKARLEDFKSGTSYNVLVATSLVEEGVDLKNCDLVIAYGVDGVLASGKSVIQNQGRARMRDAEFIILCKNFKDQLRVSKVKNQVRAVDKLLAGKVAAV